MLMLLPSKIVPPNSQPALQWWQPSLSFLHKMVARPASFKRSKKRRRHSSGSAFLPLSKTNMLHHHATDATLPLLWMEWVYVTLECALSGYSTFYLAQLPRFCMRWGIQRITLTFVPRGPFVRCLAETETRRVRTLLFIWLLSQSDWRSRAKV